MLISNVYTFRIINKTTEDFNDVHFKLLSPKGEIIMVGNEHFKVEKESEHKGTLFVEIHPAFLTEDKMKLTIGVYDGEQEVEKIKTNFLSPRQFN